MAAIRGRLFRAGAQVLSKRCCTSSMSKGEFLWNYKDQSAWGKVPGWEVSATGKRQSPIHIETKNLVVNNILTPLKMEGWDAAISGTFKNTGHSLQFTPESSKAMLTTPHGRFVFKQFHFHWGSSSDEGSEHCVDGFSFATEIHFVHEKTEDSDDSLAVIGILCHANEISNGTQHWEEVVVPQEAGEVARVDNVKMCNYLTHDLDYYHYKGSLTTPPFTENVLWYVVKQPLHIPEQLLLKLRQMKDFEGQMLTSNHRQCMPLHNRIVETPRLI